MLFKTREFGDASVAKTAGAFFFHMIGLPFIGANRILAPAFYARGDTRTPALAGIIAVAINIVAAMALQPAMGGSGIALALSIASAVNAAALIVMLRRAGIDGIGAALGSVALYVVRLLVFSAVAAAPVLLLRGAFKAWFGVSGAGIVAYGVPFLFSGLVFAAVGIGLLVALEDPAAAFLVASVRGRSRKQANRPD